MACEWQKFIPYISGDWKSKIRVPVWSGSWWGPVPQGADRSPHSVSSNGGRGSRALWSLRALILFMGAPPTWPIHLSKVLPPRIITLGVRVSEYEFVARHRHSVCNTGLSFLVVFCITLSNMLILLFCALLMLEICIKKSIYCQPAMKNEDLTQDLHLIPSSSLVCS